MADAKTAKPRGKAKGEQSPGRSPGDDAPAGAGSIFKALRILEQIVENPGPVSVAQLATVLNISKPTAHRIATILEEFGFLEREPAGRRFVESQRLIDLV